MMSSRMSTVLMLVLAYFMWSTGFIVIKTSLQHMGFLQLMTLRMLPPMLVFALLWKKVRPARVERADFKWLALMVLCDPLGTLFFQTHALPLTTASQSGMIFACTPLIMAAAARLLFKEKIRRRCMAGIVCAFIGVSLVALTGHSSAAAPDPVRGNLFSLCAVMSLVCYTLTVKRLAGRFRPQELLCVQAVGATLVQVPLFFLLPPPAGMMAAVPMHIYVAIIYMGFFPACLGYLIVNRAVSTIKAAHVSLINTLVPVFVMLLGHVVLGERLIAFQYLGSGLVIAGAVLAGMPEPSELNTETQAS